MIIAGAEMLSTQEVLKRQWSSCICLLKQCIYLIGFCWSGFWQSFFFFSGYSTHQKRESEVKQLCIHKERNKRGIKKKKKKVIRGHLGQGQPVLHTSVAPYPTAQFNNWCLQWWSCIIKGMQSSPLESLLKCVQLLLGRFPFEIFKSLSIGPDGTGFGYLEHFTG